VDGDASQGRGEPDLTREARELTALLRGLRAEDLNAADRATLRALRDELQALVDHHGPHRPASTNNTGNRR
jgi:hypothetical protein